MARPTDCGPCSTRSSPPPQVRLIFSSQSPKGEQNLPPSEAVIRSVAASSQGGRSCRDTGITCPVLVRSAFRRTPFLAMGNVSALSIIIWFFAVNWLRKASGQGQVAEEVRVGDPAEATSFPTLTSLPAHCLCLLGGSPILAAGIPTLAGSDCRQSCMIGAGRCFSKKRGKGEKIA